MKAFLPPDFAKRAAKEGVSDGSLREAVARADRGLIDAQLGLSLIKQRIPRRGQGRSGGFRTIVAYERGKLAVFLHIFAKNAKANLTEAETEALRALAGYLTRLSDEQLAQLASERGWRQIDDEPLEKDARQ
ncbi:protein of unknown function DUF1044 [Methylorubrum populi BJ001]|jgi:hypothetical protein|uniref:Type II toxin-antitoxin system RelE/ParE family toxin n=1 Tax=Methylorubrum populi (strain ATCC BAA-705 / NCIMB 13946 / BJ001) TaxID=441620 RepID=B1ZE24_METPB|nr:type II toxin-antitoxin system RelE/ParE family toxin [Methylorubrum populi]ACB82417.1 protein of unknown function DUF1044 [Methylorubrum populi BJ001]OAH36014.1 hypothetical protein AX289_23855 [Methylorubrum populi]PZP70190.1 MAG: hypothetical protein DI590_11535 [Methylorubrum populi]